MVRFAKWVIASPMFIDLTLCMIPVKLATIFESLGTAVLTPPKKSLLPDIFSSVRPPLRKYSYIIWLA